MKEKISALKGEYIDKEIIKISSLIKKEMGFDIYDSQIKCAKLLISGNVIIEMDTGEGKTLSATIAALILAKNSRKVYVISANEYLAERDAKTTKSVLMQYSSETIASVNDFMSIKEKKSAYESDIVYLSYQQLAQDYLQDCLVTSVEEYLDIKFDVAIVDEADASMIDECSEPLKLSTKCESDLDLLRKAVDFTQKLSTEDVYRNNQGYHLNRDILVDAKQFFDVKNYYDDENFLIRDNIKKALNARFLLKKDVDYWVKGDQLVLIDRATGRGKPNFSYSNGVQQAVQMNENLNTTVSEKNSASITYQTLFNKFNTLSAMSGTAIDEADEFKTVYNLKFKRVEPNKTKIRIDAADKLFLDSLGRDKKLCETAKELSRNNVAVLVCTKSVEETEIISGLLNGEGVSHNVLNAKFEELEANIILDAGVGGSITVCTNMAGRGTDIRLNDESRATGGLHVLFRGHYPSIRTENQLRGRAGRQGDPGYTQCYVSMDDEFMKESHLDAIGKKLLSSNNTIAFSKAIIKQQRSKEKDLVKIRSSVFQYNELFDKQFNLLRQEKLELMNKGVSDKSILDINNLWAIYLDSVLRINSEVSQTNGFYDKFIELTAKEYDLFIEASRDIVSLAFNHTCD